ncbi:MAG TPA: hypothetical protein VIV65_06090 [Gemmatimonadaceae bacterium]
MRRIPERILRPDYRGRVRNSLGAKQIITALDRRGDVREVVMLRRFTCDGNWFFGLRRVGVIDRVPLRLDARSGLDGRFTHRRFREVDVYRGIIVVGVWLAMKEFAEPSFEAFPERRTGFLVRGSPRTERPRVTRLLFILVRVRERILILGDVRGDLGRAAFMGDRAVLFFLRKAGWERRSSRAFEAVFRTCHQGAVRR